MFAKSPLAQFLAGSAGRVTRALAGLILIALGALVIQGLGGWIVAVIGLVPLAAGVFDFCLLTALLGGRFWGRDIRALGAGARPRN